jgi:nitrate reductase assembly molybdenum cofactor insertion protein NarJ
LAEIIDIRGPLGARDFAAAKAQLAEVLNVIAEEMDVASQDMAEAADPTAFASVVHAVAERLTEASERWNALLKAIQR